MPFREKAKNLFKRRESKDRSPSDLYYTEESMPKPKYRRVPAKEHTDKLEAFSFGDAWRKRSFQSTHSPGGTRASSRRGSRLSLGGRKDKDVRNSQDRSRANSGVSDGQDHHVLKREGVPLAHEPIVAEQEGDADVTNVGLSRAATAHPKTDEDAKPNGQPNGLYKTLSTAHDHQPFTEHDLAQAMQRSRLEVSVQ